MNKNPYLNALYAGAYIVLLVSGAFVFGGGEGGADEANIIYPITALSLLVLSVCVMAYLMLLRPLMMYLDGQKKEAIEFFVKTIATFAGVCLIFVAVALIVTGSRTVPACLERGAILKTLSLATS